MINSLIKELDYNSVNNTYDSEDSSVVFGFKENGDLDYFRIKSYQNDYNPEIDSVITEMNQRIKELQSVLEFLSKFKLIRFSTNKILLSNLLDNKDKNYPD